MADDWHVLYTKPRAEAKTRDALLARQVDVYLPLLTVHARGKPPQQQPLFPRYLFVRFDPAVVSPDVLHWTPGLVSMVSFGEEPATMPAEAITMIRERLGELEDKGGLPTHEFQPGDRVHIRSGPLQGLCAIFEGPMIPSERVKLLVHFLNRNSRVEIPVEDVEPMGQGLVEKKGRRSRGARRPLRSLQSPPVTS